MHKKTQITENAQLIQGSVSILRRKQVEQKTGLARSTIYDRMKAGVFPKPIQLGNSRVVGWIESEIDEWLSGCVKESRLTADKWPTSESKNDGQVRV